MPCTLLAVLEAVHEHLGHVWDKAGGDLVAFLLLPNPPRACLVCRAKLRPIGDSIMTEFACDGQVAAS